MAQRRLKSGSRGWTPPTMSSEDALDLQRPECSDTLRGHGAEVFWLSPCPPCHFSGKSRPGSSKGVGSGHPELAPLACDLYCPKGPTLRRDPTSVLPVLKCLVFLEQGVTHVCFVSHTFIFHWLLQIGLLARAPSGMRRRKERYPPSFSFLSYQIHKQIVLLFPPSCFL